MPQEISNLIKTILPTHLIREIFPNERFGSGIAISEIVSNLTVSKGLIEYLNIMNSVGYENHSVPYAILAGFNATWAGASEYLKSPTNEESTVASLNMMREWTNEIFAEHPTLEKIRPAIAPIATATATILGMAGVESIAELIGIHAPSGLNRETWNSIVQNPGLKAVLVTTWMYLSRTTLSWITTPFKKATP